MGFIYLWNFKEFNVGFLYEYNNIFLLHKVKKQLKIKFNTNIKK